MDPPAADPPSPVAMSDDEYDSSQADDSQADASADASTNDDETDNDDETEDGGDDGDGSAAGSQEGQQRRPRQRGNRPPRDYTHLRLKATPELALLANPEIASSVREIGKTASWSLSTAKPGNGVDQLRDSSLDTYWQSDGLQPHYVNIQFPRRQTVCAIALYMDFNLDESYTPKRMKIKVGTTFHNLEEVRTVDVKEPQGWITIPLWRKWGEDVLDTILDPEGGAIEDEIVDGRRTKVPLWKRNPMRTHLVQICVLSMHQNGRDTHVRQVKIFGPRDYGSTQIVGQNGVYRGLSNPLVGKGGTTPAKRGSSGKQEPMASGKLSVPAFQTVGMSQFSMIR